MSAAPLHLIDEQSPFASLGEQLQAVANAGMGRTIDPRLLALQRRTTPAANAAGSSEMVPGDGGFAVQPEFVRELMQRMYQTGDLLARCTEIPIKQSNALAFPQLAETSRVGGSRLGGVQAFSENEAQTLVKSKPAFALNTIEANKLTILMYVTDELAMDSSAISSWATYAASQELTFALENLIITGTGAGEPLGVINSPALVAVAKETGQATGSVVTANITKMMSGFWTAGRKNAVWMYNQGLLNNLLLLTTTVGAGGSQTNLFQFQNAEGDYDRLCGIPALPSEYCSAPGSFGDIILLDPTRYVVAMRERLRGEVSVHVNFLSDESAFRFVMRVGGQPIDVAPVTPLNGTTATSPFVSLQSRP